MTDRGPVSMPCSPLLLSPRGTPRILMSPAPIRAGSFSSPTKILSQSPRTRMPSPFLFRSGKLPPLSFDCPPDSPRLKPLPSPPGSPTPLLPPLADRDGALRPFGMSPVVSRSPSPNSRLNPVVRRPPYTFLMSPRRIAQRQRQLEAAGTSRSCSPKPPPRRIGVLQQTARRRIREELAEVAGDGNQEKVQVVI